MFASVAFSTYVPWYFWHWLLIWIKNLGARTLLGQWRRQLGSWNWPPFLRRVATRSRSYWRSILPYSCSKITNFCFQCGTSCIMVLCWFVQTPCCPACTWAANEDVILIDPIYMSLTGLREKVKMYRRIACWEPQPRTTRPHALITELCDNKRY